MLFHSSICPVVERLKRVSLSETEHAVPFAFDATLTSNVGKYQPLSVKEVDLQSLLYYIMNCRFLQTSVFILIFLLQAMSVFGI